MTSPIAVSRPKTARIRWNEASGRPSHAVSGPNAVRIEPT